MATQLSSLGTDSAALIARIVGVLMTTVLLSACGPPTEFRAALGEPGEAMYDERLVGSWYAEIEGDALHLYIAPRGETPFLDILAVKIGDPPVAWIAAEAYASSVDNTLLYNVKRIPGIGGDYTLVKADSFCRPVAPEHAPGFILFRAEVTEANRLKLRRMRLKTGYLESREHLVSEVFASYGGERFPLSVRMLEFSRPELIALIREVTPEQLFSNATFWEREGDAPAIDSFQRLSHEAPDIDFRELAQLRFRALLRAAKAQVAVGDVAGSLTTAKLAESTAACVGIMEHRDEILEIKGLAGELEGMLEVAESREPGWDRDRVYWMLSGVHVTAGEFAEALAVGDRIDSKQARFEVLINIISKQIEQGDGIGVIHTLDLALATAVTDEDREFRAFNLLRLAEAQATLNDAAGARKTLDAVLNDRGECSGDLYTIWKIELRIGDEPGADRTFSLLRNCAPLIEEVNQRIHLMTTLATAMANKGEVASAIEFLHRTFESLGQRQDFQYRDRVAIINRAFSHIARLQAEAGDLAGAKNTADMALEHADLAGGGSPLLIAAGAQALAGDLEKAVEIYRSAGNDQEAVALGTIGAILTQAGRAHDAWEMIQNDLSELDMHEPDSWHTPLMHQVFFLEVVGTTMAKAGDDAGAARCFEESLKIARGMAFQQVDAFLSITETLREVGDAAGAKRTAGLALEAVERIADPAARVEALSEVAEALHEAGDVSAAKETAARAAEYARQVPLR